MAIDNPCTTKSISNIQKRQRGASVRCNLRQQGNKRPSVNYLSTPSFVTIETFSLWRQR